MYIFRKLRLHTVRSFVDISGQVVIAVGMGLYQHGVSAYSLLSLIIVVSVELLTDISSPFEVIKILVVLSWIARVLERRMAMLISDGMKVLKP